MTSDTSEPGTERWRVATPESWLSWLGCLFAGHEWSDWTYRDGTKQKECYCCGLQQRWVEPLVADGGEPQEAGEQLDRAGDECYWCGGDLADGGSIRAQMREGEPKRETCPDCFRDWPPEQVEEEYMDEESGDADD